MTKVHADAQKDSIQALQDLAQQRVAQASSLLQMGHIQQALDLYQKGLDLVVKLNPGDS